MILDTAKRTPRVFLGVRPLRALAKDPAQRPSAQALGERFAAALK